MELIFEKVRNILSVKPNAIIGIDGYCASGKTTLAMQIAQKFNAQVVHMDDFFLPFDMRTEKRLSETGGNVHYERFNAEVVSGFEKGSEFDYRAFCCQNGTYAETKEILPDKPTIIEGSYAFHPEIRLNYDLKIFVKADYDVRLSRILERNGMQALETFKSKWIPLENRYFDEFKIEEKCDIIKQTGN